MATAARPLPFAIHQLKPLLLQCSTHTDYQRLISLFLFDIGMVQLVPPINLRIGSTTDLVHLKKNQEINKIQSKYINSNVLHIVQCSSLSWWWPPPEKGGFRFNSCLRTPPIIFVLKKKTKYPTKLLSLTTCINHEV